MSRVRSHEAERVVREALRLGLVVHAAHPDFGGVCTAGPYRRAVGEPGFALLHHGGSTDVTDDDFKSMPGFDAIAALSRTFVFQVGRDNAHQGAIDAIHKAGGS